MSERVVVVGGGIVGLSVAWALQRRGRDVVVLERGRCGDGASGAAAGMIGALAELQGPGVPDPLMVASRAMWPRFARALEAASGLAVEHATSGIRVLANHPGVVEGHRAWAASLQRQGFCAEVHDRTETLAAEPSAHPGTVGSLWLPGEATVDNQEVVAALRRVVTVHERTEVVAVSGEGARTAEGDWPGTVIVAGGAWSAQLAGGSVKPVRGESIVVQGAPGLLRSALYGGGGYAVPRPDGRVILGATMEDRGFDSTPSDEGAGQCRRIGAAIAPALAALPVVEQRCGLRPTTRDHVPVIDQVRPGVWVCTGHYRNGIALAPASAALLADRMLGPGGAPW